MASSQHDFFVSYTSADEAWAEWIAHVLEEAGYAVVIQAWDFRPGSNFVIEMQKALQTSDRLIAVLSPDYLAARFPQPEWAAVFAADPEGVRRSLVPVMVRSCAPDGLLSQVVQIRIHDLESDVAKQKLLDGVRTGRVKPSVAPVFPGAGLNAPVVAASAPTRSSTRLTWRHVPSPRDVIWRSALENRLPNQSGYETVEVHLVPVGEEARLQVSELAQLSAVLPAHGRQHGIFSAAEGLDVRSDAAMVSVISTERGAVAGLAVTRSGQRSAWSALPHDMLGAVLDESHLADQLARLLDGLAALRVPEPELVVPAVEIEPARMISVGRIAEMPRSSASLGHGMPEFVRPAADEAVDFPALRAHARRVASELTARLVAEHRTAARLM